MRPLVFVVILLGCGRFGFDPLDGDRAPSDAPPSDARPNDAQPVSLELLAGDLGGPGNLDGTGAGARFNFPSTVAVDSVGNLYVADTDNAVIRKVTAVGVVTTLAGAAGLTGSADGTGAAARFNLPIGVAIDSGGNLYVADAGNDTIRKITAAGVVTTLAGSAGASGSADGTGAAARFFFPVGVAVDSAGNVYVTDGQNETVRKVTAAGVVTTLSGSAGVPGSANGAGSTARFSSPLGVAVDSTGNLYVADEDNYTIRKITPAGVVTTLAGTAGTPGSADGTGPAARFSSPTGVAVDLAGNIYVADAANHSIRKVTAAGVVTTLAGAADMPGSVDGTAATARFSIPEGVAVDPAGNVYVADTGNDTIRKITAGVVTTLAGAALAFGSADGTGAVARFTAPHGVAIDSAGNVYVADMGNDTIRKITDAGMVTTFAGTAGLIGSADGTSATARFNLPTGVVIDGDGNLYVADAGNATIRKITAAGVVTTLTGAARVFGSVDGTGATARFNLPSGVAVDAAGNLYVTDEVANTLRKVTAAGVVTTLAGTARVTGSADGTGAAAQFSAPSGVAVDGAGNVYVADMGNDTIRKITAAGVVTTLAGTVDRFGSADGTGTAAQFNSPSGVAVDGVGNVYVADMGNDTIRKITPTGVVTTIAGMAGVSGILLGATPRLETPSYLAIAGDSIVISELDSILVLRHGAR